MVNHYGKEKTFKFFNNHTISNWTKVDYKSKKQTQIAKAEPSQMSKTYNWFALVKHPKTNTKINVAIKKPLVGSCFSRPNLQ